MLSTPAAPAVSSFEKWSNLSLLALAELLAMVLWFSASAVVPQLIEAWNLNQSQQSWMTMSVQIGFVVGALVSAGLNLADRVSSLRLVAISAFAGSAVNLMIPLFQPGIEQTLFLRFLTGVCLAGVYPPGMKIVATWAKTDRGLGIGLLVGALTVGSAVPHFLNAIPIFGEGGMPPWRSVLFMASATAAGGGLIVSCCAKTGPYLSDTAPFNWRYAGQVVTNRPIRLANFGYLGHMWELYAMWTWAPILILASYEAAGWSLALSRLAGFGVIAIGGVGSILAGALADRIGRTTTAIWSLIVSGSCALVAGLFFEHPGVLTAICLIWGFAVVADSAQFSAAVSELSDPRYVGTALTMQTSLGFLLTLASIHLIPPLVEAFGWNRVFLILVIGPVFGIWSMVQLRRQPEAARMASGNR